MANYTVRLDNVTGPDVVSLGDGTTYATLSVNTNVSTPLVSDTNPTLSADLNLNGNDITGTGDISITGSVTATTGSFTGDITATGGDVDLDTLDLNAIAETKGVTAVDVFVYDTSKDSDGGAWRKRTQGTSWYNETLNTATRGSRREFPVVAVIVAESDDVTIYDGDDPSLPMWLKFDRTAGVLAYTSVGAKALSMLNGEMQVATPSGLMRFNFLSDIMRFQQGGGDRQKEGIVNRQTVSLVSVGKTDYLASSTINDIAMTVLPDAPIDPATGLPVPTIACLVGETEVLMADGSTKRLDQVQPGEVVKTLEGQHRVLNWWDQGIKDVIELEFDGGQKLICTTDHKIRTTEGWVEAGDLTEDHEVVAA